MGKLPHFLARRFRMNTGSSFQTVFPSSKAITYIKLGVDVNLIHELLINLFQGDGNYSYNQFQRICRCDGTLCPAGECVFCRWVADAVGANVGDGFDGGKNWNSFTQVNDPITHVGKDDFYDNDFAAYIEDTWKRNQILR